jgi:hypothetical protein
VRGWKSVSLDAVTGNDQTGNKYWQRIGKISSFMPPMLEPSTRILRSLQAKYDAINQCCSRWSGCLEQVRNAPPSGCTVEFIWSFRDNFLCYCSLQLCSFFRYFVKIGLHSTRKVQANGLFKDKSFVLQHYRKLLEHSE